MTLLGGELVYFELDRAGQLQEFSERMSLSDDANCIELSPVPPGLQRAKFLCVGLDESVRIVSLEPSKCLEPLSTQVVPGKPESLCLVEISDVSGGTALSLSIGLENGVLLRNNVDQVTVMLFRQYLCV